MTPRAPGPAAVLRASVVMVALSTAAFGVVYPLVMTGVAQLVFPVEARGTGEGLVGQAFTGAGFFWGRPSGSTPPYLATSSTPLNHGPTNPAFLEAVKQRVGAIRAAHPDQPGPVPADLVTASGSGLDPHISVAAATYQVSRVAAARAVSPAEVERLIQAVTEPRFLGIFGEPRVNVVKLNRAVAALGPVKAPPATE